MSDQWIKDAERRGNELELYGDWVHNHQTEILETYLGSVTFDDVPDDFVQRQYEARGDLDE